jgi:hypothetical protein
VKLIVDLRRPNPGVELDLENGLRDLSLDFGSA